MARQEMSNHGRPLVLWIRRLRWAVAVALGSWVVWAPGAEPPAPTLVNQARLAFQQGRTQAAIDLASRAIEADPGYAQAYYVRGRIYQAVDEPSKAIADYDVVLKMTPRATGVYERRGELQFELGHYQSAVENFNRFLAGAPQEMARHWPRGIACYFAGLYPAGMDQFKLHRTLNSNDVETAVWYFLCEARARGIKAARKDLFKVGHDDRVPMTQIYALYAGKGSAAAVFAAAKAGHPEPDKQKRRLFYAHLYVGLYEQVTGKLVEARQHLQQASTKFQIRGFLGTVARAAYREAQKKPK